MASVVAEYLEKESSAHRVDARSKIAMLAAYSVGIFFVDTWWGMAAYAAMFAAAFAASGVPAKRVFAHVAPIYVIAALTIVLNMFHVEEGWIAFSVDGLLRGCFFALRILLLVWASLVLCFAVKSTELTAAASSILSPLRVFGAPVDDMATVFSITLRFIPQTSEEFFAIRDAQWSRCAAFDEGTVAERVKAHCTILIPMIVGMFRRADKLALSMDSRCYGMRGVRRCDIRSRRVDALSATAMIAAIVACSAVALLL